MGSKQRPKGIIGSPKRLQDETKDKTCMRKTQRSKRDVECPWGNTKNARMGENRGPSTLVAFKL